MEEFRDERLSRIMAWMQAWARGYINRKTFKKLQEQRIALTIVQRALRRYLKLRTWPWWKLWQKVKPLLNASRVEDQLAVSICISQVNQHFINMLLHSKSFFRYPMKIPQPCSDYTMYIIREWLIYPPAICWWNIYLPYTRLITQKYPKYPSINNPHFNFMMWWKMIHTGKWRK